MKINLLHHHSYRANFFGELLCVLGANGLHHRRSEVDADAGSLIRGKDDRLCPPNIADFIR
jgi:hypothetical protein